MGLLVAAGAAMALAGCALPKFSTAKAPVDPNSPVARDVAYAEKHPGPYPRFADIPKIPTDVPSSTVISSAVLDLNREEQRLDAQAAALPPPATDTEAFAASKQPQAPAGAEAPGPNSESQTEAYARTLRERATPPPPLR